MCSVVWDTARQEFRGQRWQRRLLLLFVREQQQQQPGLRLSALGGTGRLSVSVVAQLESETLR